MKPKKLPKNIVEAIKKNYPELLLFFSENSQYFEFCVSDRRYDNKYIDYIDGLFWVINYKIECEEKSPMGFETFDEALTYFNLRYL